ncbi:Uncharacterised protein family UPF0729 [Cinara cedri]|uniref:Uncharacterized protein n=1 Tax=Cinara cedri TaxID=506608 RepID=A0A5E4M864_9HEMI|nr:Uncharacterised protein family UPF0729 [Cinara cedri]
MVCVPCIMVPMLLFLWAMIKPIINWFRRPNEIATDQNNTVDDQSDNVCSLLSSCPCINKKNIKPGDDQAAETNGDENEELLEKKPCAKVSDIDKKRV